MFPVGAKENGFARPPAVSAAVPTLVLGRAEGFQFDRDFRVGTKT